MSGVSRLRIPALVYLTGQNLLIGIWAAFFPRSFFDDFPGLGRVWVAVDGPYNEHLVRDVGAAVLGLAVVTTAALITRREMVIRTAGWASLVFGLPHVIYHARHVDPLDVADAIGTVSLLALGTLAAVVLVIPDSSSRVGVD